jgi:excisionase family DNA binding protein
MPEVLFVREVAEIMRMSKATVYKYIREGDLKAEQYGRGKNSMRVSREAFEEWREKHRVKPTDETSA